MYPCEHCNKSFRWQSSLQRHKLTHSGERPYVCPECAKSFAQKSHLQKHVRTHNKSLHRCSICQRTFPEQRVLDQHVHRRHQGEQPYPCLECDKSFNWLSDLQRHIRVHTGERPYRCSACTLTFSQKTHLLKHKQQRHWRKSNLAMTDHTVELYGYGLLLVLLISGCSLLGVFLIPCMTQNVGCGRAYIYVNTLMVSCAVSALFCDAILLLIPEMFGLGGEVHVTNFSSGAAPAHSGIEGDKTPFLWKACMVIAGAYTFYLLESLLRQCTGEEGDHDHSLLKPGHDSSLAVSSDSELEYTDSPPDKMSYLTTDSAGDPAVWHRNGYLEKKQVMTSYPFKVHSCVPNLAAKDTCSCLLSTPPCKWLKAVKPLAWLIILGDGLHNFADGIALGVSISQGLSLGVSTAVAMIIHEIPHELVTLPSFSPLERTLSRLTGWILGATAGVFLYIALVDLLPTLTHPKKGISELCFFVLTNVGMVVTFVLLLLIAIYQEELDRLILDP
eukprot:Em0006g632a